MNVTTALKETEEETILTFVHSVTPISESIRYDVCNNFLVRMFGHEEDPVCLLHMTL